MLLVQGIDIYNIYKNWTECWDVSHNAPDCEVGIAPSNDTIPRELKKVITFSHVKSGCINHVNCFIMRT